MESNEMGSLPVGRLLKKMSMPLIISMLVQVLYGLVDSLYVAQLGGNALTAISLCIPVQYLVVGVGTGIGVGVNSVLSKKLGEKDGSGVNKTAGNGFILLWIVMILFAVLGLTAIESFYIIQTDIQEIRDMCISYSIVLCVCSFAAFHQIMMERLLAAIGRADLTMIPMLVGAVVNIILDPVMNVLHMKQRINNMPAHWSSGNGHYRCRDCNRNSAGGSGSGWSVFKSAL